MPATACYALLAALTYSIEVRAAPKLQPRGAGEFGEFRRPGERPAPRKAAPRGPYSKVKRVPGGYALEYGFQNFNGDSAKVAARLDAETVAQSIKEFGFREDEFKALDAWYQKAQAEAIALAESKYARGEVKARSREELDAKLRFINDINKGVQKKLEAELAALSAEYRRKRIAVYEKAGFRFKDAKSVEADIPGLAKRNWKRVRPVAKAFSELADENGYEAEDLVGAVTAMVQTALRYEVPETREGSRVIGGAMPPPQTLVLGQGDCDTKTALIASVLLNWPNVKMVGLGIPGHYLMAYHRIPRSGDIFIEYQGLPYIMIESAGPAWLAPGTVGDQTRAYLESGRDFRIQPITL